ncbi:hypothetical protein NL676_029440 [Syzygium grande]|nr:hypothetical protein NL676_029440 [Syzygium grande]
MLCTHKWDVQKIILSLPYPRHEPINKAPCFHRENSNTFPRQARNAPKEKTARFKSNYLQTIRVKRGLEPALELENHARVQFDGESGLASAEELIGEVTGAGNDLEDDVGLL